MDLGQIAETTSNGKIGSALITIILAGFLWVGKTTFEHVGQITGLRHELEATQAQDVELRKKYDRITSMLNERTKSRFTREDADKLTLQIKDVEKTFAEFKDTLLRDYNGLKLEFANIESSVHSSSHSPPVAMGLQASYRNASASDQQVEQLQRQIVLLQADVRHLQSQLRARTQVATETAASLLAQPNLDPVPITKR